MEKGRESGNTTGDNMWVCPKCGVYVVSMRTLVQTNRAFSWISQLLAEIQVVPTAVLAMSLNKVSCQVDLPLLCMTIINIGLNRTNGLDQNILVT
jgi:hypothetical protein